MNEIRYRTDISRDDLELMYDHVEPYNQWRRYEPGTFVRDDSVVGQRVYVWTFWDLQDGVYAVAERFDQLANIRCTFIQPSVLKST